MARIARTSCAVLLALAGCIPIDAFECMDDNGCNRGGVEGHCEEVGVCSYDDSDCDGGRRYSPNAGALADECVPVAASTTTTCVGSTDECDDCTSTTVGGRFFELCATPRTWSEARDACAMRSMSLASVHDDAQNDALGVLVPSPTVVWIGLSDRDAEDDYAWVDLSPADYTSWGSNEPEDADGEEDCVALGNAGAWSAWRCEIPQGYACAEPP